MSRFGEATSSWRTWVMSGALAVGAAFAAEARGQECRSIDAPWPTAGELEDRTQQARIEPVRAEGEGSPIKPRATVGLLRLIVTQEQVNLLRRVRERLAPVALMYPAVAICESEVVNAIAFSRGQGVPESGLILIYSGLMELIGHDEAKAASMMSHEMAHILEDHSGLRARFDQRARREAVEVGRAEEARYRGVGTLAALHYFVQKRAAYSRDIERRADEVGYRIYEAAGYDPRAVTNLYVAIRDRLGGSQAGYRASHPGTDERIALLLELSQVDARQAEIAANSQAVAAESERNAAIAEEHIKNRRRRELSQHVSAWLAALPTSGRGWYYRGRLMRGSASERSMAWKAFAKGVELDRERPEIWEEYVQSLEENGYRQEAVAALAEMSALGHSTRALRERVFVDDRIWAHGGARGSPLNLWWARDETGQRVIANIRSSFSSRGLREEPIAPEWVPAQ